MIPKADVRFHIAGLEMDLLRVVLQKVNMAFLPVTTPEEFEWGKDLLFQVMIEKEAYKTLGGLIITFGLVSHFDISSPHYFTCVHWYVPCFVKNPRWAKFLEFSLWNCG